MKTILSIAAVLACGATFIADAADDSAAEALAKKSKCFTCHSVDKKKVGPSFKETAAKYKGKADAQQKLFTHLTTNPKVKIDGKEEMHDSLKTKNDVEVKNVVAWILSR
jgi:cytochrome c